MRPIRLIAVLLAAALASAAAAEQRQGRTGREGFCAGEPNFQECVEAGKGRKTPRATLRATEACAELAEYTTRKERLEWERCLARENKKKN